MWQFDMALEEIRAEESKRLVCDGYEPVLNADFRRGKFDDTF